MLDISGHVVVVLGQREELLAQRALRSRLRVVAQLPGGFAEVAGVQHAAVPRAQAPPVSTRFTVLTSSALLTGLRSTALAPSARAVLK